MVRFGIVSYLMLALAAGPWYCCCSIARLHELLTPTVAEATSETTKPLCTCCCPSEEAPAPAGFKQPLSPVQQPKHPGCPCSDRKELKPVLASGGASSSQEVQTRHILADLLPIATSLFSCSVMEGDAVIEKPRESLAFPFLSAQDILRHLQTFRC